MVIQAVESCIIGLGIICAGAVAGILAWYVSAQVLRRFTFIGYNHSEK